MTLKKRLGKGWIIAAFSLAALLVFAMGNEVGMAKSDASPPEGKIDMTGDIGDYVPGEIDDPVHDPSIFKDGDTYYVVSTGALRTTEEPGGIFIRKSEETIGGEWEAIGEIPTPEWTQAYNVAHLWAPHVVKKGDTFYLYYAASIFGTNNSAIGAAKTKTPGDVNSWEDLGPVLTSEPGEVNYNAIDPMVVKDKGKWWMIFGSHFSGIHMQELKNMTEPVGPVYSIASRAQTTEHNSVEGPTVFKKGKYYYLVTSWDRCCAGLDSTYKMAIGRSESITGPYVDKEGVPLLEGGGTVILTSDGNQVGPGGQDYIKDRGRDYLLHHYYDGDADGIIRMQVRSLSWEDGWPVLTQ